MASSSVSQEDVINDYEKNTRRSRIRTARARQINPGGCRTESCQAAGTHSSLSPCSVLPSQCNEYDGDGFDEQAVPCGGAGACSSFNDNAGQLSSNVAGIGLGSINEKNQETVLTTSPKSVIRSSKEPNTKRLSKLLHHPVKSKPQPRDRRKLREKRRSTGVVNLASTESAGGTTTGDESPPPIPPVSSATGFESCESTGCVLVDEMPDKTPSCSSPINQMLLVVRNDLTSLCSNKRRNKSPSDLEADDENDKMDDLTMNDVQPAPPPCRHIVPSASVVCSDTDNESNINLTASDGKMNRLLKLMEAKDRRIEQLECRIEQLLKETTTATTDSPL